MAGAGWVSHVIVIEVWLGLAVVGWISHLL